MFRNVRNNSEATDIRENFWQEALLSLRDIAIIRLSTRGVVLRFRPHLHCF